MRPREARPRVPDLLRIRADLNAEPADRRAPRKPRLEMRLRRTLVLLDPDRTLVGRADGPHSTADVHLGGEDGNWADLDAAEGSQLSPAVRAPGTGVPAAESTTTEGGVNTPRLQEMSSA
jgi:hypothetical protein